MIIGETGWPSGGNPIDMAIPSEANQRQFLEDFTRLADENSIEYFFFEAFDEEWKWVETLGSAKGKETAPRLKS